MTILNELRASGGSVAIIHTLELTSPAWGENSFVICNGYIDRVITTEDDRVLTASATGMDIALPEKSATGNQELRFALDNVRGEAVAALRQALSARAQVMMTYRSYLSDDLSGPADNPYRYTVRSFTAKGSQVDITAAYFHLIDTAYPRAVYTREFSPGIQYIE